MAVEANTTSNNGIHVGGKMLSNLEWIETGKQFPPQSEVKRLTAYTANEYLFLGKHRTVFEGDFATWAEQMKKRNINVETVVNYPQLLTKKTADFVCGESPLLSVGGTKNENLNNKLMEIEWDSKLYEAVMDVSRFGNAVFKIVGNDITIIPPENWFPIVDKFDQKKITEHVIAFESDDEIRIEIHSPGKIETRTYKSDKTKKDSERVFGELIETTEEQTGLEGFAVYTLSNIKHSKSIYGIDDYRAIADILRQLMWRLYCMEMILDKHSAPSMQGSSADLDIDPVTNQASLKTGNFFVRNSTDDPDVKYITWDGNLTAVQWSIDWLTNQLYTLSEMGAALLEGAGAGTAQSGTALRLRMVSPSIKARRIASINTQSIKQLLSAWAKVNSLAIKPNDISIQWRDGLPNDEAETANILERATTGKPFMSQLKAVGVFNNMDETEAEKELERINDEEAPSLVIGQTVADEG